MESVRDYEVTVVMSANAPGKTHSAASIATWFYKAFSDSKVYLAAAPPIDNLRDALWGEISAIAYKHKDLFEGDTITSLLIKPSMDNPDGDEEPRHLIRGLTIPSSGTSKEREAKFSGKHSGHILFVFDEGDAIPDEAYQGAESCMSGGFARMLILLNPREQLGEVFRMIRDKRANIIQLSAFNHPNVITGEDIIPGAVTRKKTIQRINKWCRPIAEGEEPKDWFDLPEYLVDQTAEDASGKMLPPLKAGRYAIEDSAFCYMVLGRYPAQSSQQLISMEWVYAARSRYDAYVARHGETPPVGVSPIYGQDVAEFGDDANVALFRYGGWVAPVVTWSGVERYATANKATAEYKRRGAYRCNVDASGIGIGIAPVMASDGCNAHSIFVGKPSDQKTDMGEFGTVRDQIWWAVREWLQNDPGSMLPPDELLIEELQTPTYRYDNRGKIKVMDKDTMRERLKRSPDRADALCLTFAPIEQTLDPLDLNRCAE